MKSIIKILFGLFIIIQIQSCGDKKVRTTENFNNCWKFILDSTINAQNIDFDDSQWRTLNLPHDWSIEGEFSEKNPATPGGGALPGGIGWYRKSFEISKSDSGKCIFIEFDGIYRNSEVWINGNYLGKRPYGYISFRYDLTPFIKFDKTNVIAVKVDNSKQPNSRWYSGSGIYRNVRIVKTNPVYIGHWGTFIKTPEINESTANVNIQTKIVNATNNKQNISLISSVYNCKGKKVGKTVKDTIISPNSSLDLNQNITISKPELWDIDNPVLYKLISQIKINNQIYDDYETKFGIRYFNFDSLKGFSLNGKSIKINGVCNHHDLGCLGAAINKRAIERQLQILKEMGCNAIRTSHNPPAPELLDLCDIMGFIVMDEAFDMWNKKKTMYDYAADFAEWGKTDLSDMILRDRNHPCVIIWSIGNEILEQWDTSGTRIAKELVNCIKQLDNTRPVTSACNDPGPWNNIIKSESLDLIGYNYKHQIFKDFTKTYPNKKFIATETVSGLATRGKYDMPSDSIRRWPIRWDLPFTTGNSDYTCSSYDNCSAPWGSTHEETWREIKKYDFLSGQFIWTGFDYLGEPTPYSWPARSSYFGIVDLAGFPKDVYYMYQSEWTNKPVLHVFPHWNWKTGDTIDVWAYTNASEVELFLNGSSLGTKNKTNEQFHLAWRVPFTPGTIKAIARNNGREILTQIINTAGNPYKINLTADRNKIKADGYDLSFVTVDIVDKDGNIVPYADNLINFEISGNGFIAGVDNGCQTSHEPFKANYRKAFNGKCLVVLQSNGKAGKIVLTAKADNLKENTIEIVAK
jgi:beta-galactosidase